MLYPDVANTTTNALLIHHHSELLVWNRHRSKHLLFYVINIILSILQDKKLISREIFHHLSLVEALAIEIAIYNSKLLDVIYIIYFKKIYLEPFGNIFCFGV